MILYTIAKVFAAYKYKKDFRRDTAALNHVTISRNDSPSHSVAHNP